MTPKSVHHDIRDVSFYLALSPGDCVVNTYIEPENRIVMILIKVKYDESISQFLIKAIHQPLKGGFVHSSFYAPNTWATIVKCAP